MPRPSHPTHNPCPKSDPHPAQLSHPVLPSAPLPVRRSPPSTAPALASRSMLPLVEEIPRTPQQWTNRPLLLSALLVSRPRDVPLAQRPDWTPPRWIPLPVAVPGPSPSNPGSFLLQCHGLSGSPPPISPTLPPARPALFFSRMASDPKPAPPPQPLASPLPRDHGLLSRPTTVYPPLRPQNSVFVRGHLGCLPISRVPLSRRVPPSTPRSPLLVTHLPVSHLSTRLSTSCSDSCTRGLSPTCLRSLSPAVGTHAQLLGPAPSVARLPTSADPGTFLPPPTLSDRHPSLASRFHCHGLRSCVPVLPLSLPSRPAFLRPNTPTLVSRGHPPGVLSFPVRHPLRRLSLIPLYPPLARTIPPSFLPPFLPACCRLGARDTSTSDSRHHTPTPSVRTSVPPVFLPSLRRLFPFASQCPSPRGSPTVFSHVGPQTSLSPFHVRPGKRAQVLLSSDPGVSARPNHPPRTRLRATFSVSPIDFLASARAILSGQRASVHSSSLLSVPLPRDLRPPLPSLTFCALSSQLLSARSAGLRPPRPAPRTAPLSSPTCLLVPARPGAPGRLPGFLPDLHLLVPSHKGTHLVPGSFAWALVSCRTRSLVPCVLSALPPLASPLLRPTTITGPSTNLCRAVTPRAPLPFPVLCGSPPTGRVFTTVDFAIPEPSLALSSRVQRPPSATDGVPGLSMLPLILPPTSTALPESPAVTLFFSSYAFFPTLGVSSLHASPAITSEPVGTRPPSARHPPQPVPRTVPSLPPCTVLVAPLALRPECRAPHHFSAWGPLSTPFPYATDITVSPLPRPTVNTPWGESFVQSRKPYLSAHRAPPSSGVSVRAYLPLEVWSAPVSSPASLLQQSVPRASLSRSHPVTPDPPPPRTGRPTSSFRRTPPNTPLHGFSRSPVSPHLGLDRVTLVLSFPYPSPRLTVRIPRDSPLRTRHPLSDRETTRLIPSRRYAGQRGPGTPLQRSLFELALSDSSPSQWRLCLSDAPGASSPPLTSPTFLLSDLRLSSQNAFTLRPPSTPTGVGLSTASTVSPPSLLPAPGRLPPSPYPFLLASSPPIATRLSSPTRRRNLHHRSHLEKPVREAMPGRPYPTHNPAPSPPPTQLNCPTLSSPPPATCPSVAPPRPPLHSPRDPCFPCVTTLRISDPRSRHNYPPPRPALFFSRMASDPKPAQPHSHSQVRSRTHHGSPVAPATVAPPLRPQKLRVRSRSPLAAFRSPRVPLSRRVPPSPPKEPTLSDPPSPSLTSRPVSPPRLARVPGTQPHLPPESQSLQSAPTPSSWVLLRLSLVYLHRLIRGLPTPPTNLVTATHPSRPGSTATPSLLRTLSSHSLCPHDRLSFSEHPYTRLACPTPGVLSFPVRHPLCRLSLIPPVHPLASDDPSLLPSSVPACLLPSWVPFTSTSDSVTTLQPQVSALRLPPVFLPSSRRLFPFASQCPSPRAPTRSLSTVGPQTSLSLSNVPPQAPPGPPVGSDPGVSARVPNHPPRTSKSCNTRSASAGRLHPTRPPLPDSYLVCRRGSGLRATFSGLPSTFLQAPEAILSGQRDIRPLLVSPLVPLPRDPRPPLPSRTFCALSSQLLSARAAGLRPLPVRHRGLATPVLSERVSCPCTVPCSRPLLPPTECPGCRCSRSSCHRLLLRSQRVSAVTLFFSSYPVLPNFRRVVPAPSPAITSEPVALVHQTPDTHPSPIGYPSLSPSALTSPLPWSTSTPPEPTLSPSVGTSRTPHPVPGYRPVPRTVPSLPPVHRPRPALAPPSECRAPPHFSAWGPLVHAFPLCHRHHCVSFAPSDRQYSVGRVLRAVPEALPDGSYLRSSPPSSGVSVRAYLPLEVWSRPSVQPTSSTATWRGSVCPSLPASSPTLTSPTFLFRPAVVLPKRFYSPSTVYTYRCSLSTASTVARPSLLAAPAVPPSPYPFLLASSPPIATRLSSPTRTPGLTPPFPP
nr:proline-rich protein 36-like [Equus asinus]